MLFINCYSLEAEQRKAAKPNPQSLPLSPSQSPSQPWFWSWSSFLKTNFQKARLRADRHLSFQTPKFSYSNIVAFPNTSDFIAVEHFYFGMLFLDHDQNQGGDWGEGWGWDGD